MGLLKKLFGGGAEEEGEQAARDAELKDFLDHGSVAPGTPTADDDDLPGDRPNANDKHAVVDDDVAAAFGAEVVARQLALEDESVTNVDFELRSDDYPAVSVFVCNHTDAPGMAEDDEEAWRDSGVAQELDGLGDSAFVNKEGTVFARLGDRYTIQILAGDGPTDETVSRASALARSILDRLRND
jgi:hypothetical protein